MRSKTSHVIGTMLPERSAKGMNSARRNEPSGLRAPSHQGFHAADAALRDLDLRLEIHLELVLLHGTRKLGLEFPERRLLLRRVRSIDVERELVLACILQRKLGAAKQRRCIVGVRGIHGDSERHIDEELIAADFQLRRILLREPNCRVHDGGHRVHGQKHGEAALGQTNDRRLRRQRFAQLVRVGGAERLALIVAERARDPVERIELAEQQAGQAALLTLA